MRFCCERHSFLEYNSSNSESPCFTTFFSLFSPTCRPEPLEDLLKEVSLKGSLTSLADYPHAALLYSLPSTGQMGEVLLTGLNTDLSKTWTAPPSDTRLSIPIVLPRDSRLSSIVILSDIDAQGEEETGPDVEVSLSVGMTISDRKEVERWRLGACKKCRIKKASNLW